MITTSLFSRTRESWLKRPQVSGCEILWFTQIVVDATFIWIPLNMGLTDNKPICFHVAFTENRIPLNLCLMIILPMKNGSLNSFGRHTPVSDRPICLGWVETYCCHMTGGINIHQATIWGYLGHQVSDP